MTRIRAAIAGAILLLAAMWAIAPASATVRSAPKHHTKPKHKKKPKPRKITGWTVTYTGSGTEKYTFHQPESGTFACERADQQEEGNTSVSWSVTWKNVQLTRAGGQVDRPSSWSGSATSNGFIRIGPCGDAPAVQSTCRWNLQPMSKHDHSIDSAIVVRRAGLHLAVKADIAPLVSDRGRECQGDPGSVTNGEETPTKILIIASGRATVDSLDLLKIGGFSVSTSDADAPQDLGELSPQFDCSDPSQEITCHDDASWGGTLSFTPEFAKK